MRERRGARAGPAAAARAHQRPGAKRRPGRLCASHWRLHTNRPPSNHVPRATAGRAAAVPVVRTNIGRREGGNGGESRRKETSVSFRHFRHFHSDQPQPRLVPQPSSLRVWPAMRGPPRVHTARTVRCAATPPRQPPLGFAAPNAAAVRVAILGDLHLDSRHTPSFDAAAADIRRLLEQGAADGLEPRLIQLGDLGASAEAPGTSRLFESARGFLASALPPGAPPPALVVGNHDLEGVTEFDGLFPHDDTGKEADAANLAAWSSVFNQAPTWAAPLGPALAIGLSTTTWRSNRDSVHEVAIPVEEIQWFEDTIADAARSSTPVLVFTHAPPRRLRPARRPVRARAQ